MSNNNLCIIPARGGSKRIPRKNIKLFLGKPIIAYSIEAALKSGCFKEVMVSTDDEEIARVAREYGAIVPSLRSSKNADDFATIKDVVDEVIDAYIDRGVKFDNICCLFATAPLVQVKLLIKGLSILLEKEVDSVRPIVRFSYPIQRAFKFLENGAVEMINEEHLKTRTQDLEPAYYDAGMFYWMRFPLGLKGKKNLHLRLKKMRHKILIILKTGLWQR
ncbi:pseudaminic acid cytidylyltransferase [Croceiramulus getboli]|nr:pseudaminic acid cytidylyltransferase [Flavobacteriaceae bacterium YJPT1-3]